VIEPKRAMRALATTYEACDSTRWKRRAWLAVSMVSAESVREGARTDAEEVSDAIADWSRSRADAGDILAVSSRLA